MKQLSRWIGRGFLLLAFALFTAIVINPMRLGGDAWGGKEEDGRYFVVSTGHRYTEVSEIEWRIEQYLEWCFFLPVVLVWIGLAFLAASGVHQKGPIAPPGEPTPMWMVFASIGVTAVGAGVGWLIGRAPWTAFTGGWLAFSFSVAAAVWLLSRSLRQRSNADAGAAPDNDRNSESGSS
jgi:hypothetical protein